MFARLLGLNSVGGLAGRSLESKAKSGAGAAKCDDSSKAANPTGTLRRPIRRYAYSIFLIFALACFALNRSGSRADTLSAPDDSARVVFSAASLLDRSGAVLGTPPESPAAMSGKPAGGKIDNDLSTSSLVQLREFARTHGRPDLSGLVHLSDAEAGALHSARRAVDSNGSSQAAPAAARPPFSPIPEQIEGIPRADLRGDALGTLEVRAILKLMDDGDAPWAVREIRSTAGVSRVRMDALSPGVGWVPLPGWLEAGDAPSYGWRLLAVRSQDVLLATPLGNLMRLPLRPEPASAAVGPRTHAATDRPEH